MVVGPHGRKLTIPTVKRVAQAFRHGYWVSYTTLTCDAELDKHVVQEVLLQDM